MPNDMFENINNSVSQNRLNVWHMMITRRRKLQAIYFGGRGDEKGEFDMLYLSTRK